MVVETLRDAKTHGWRIVARCAHGGRDGMKSIRECTFRQDLDLDTLIWTRGGPFPLSRLAQRMICPACRSPRVAILFETPSATQTMGKRLIG